MKWASIARMWHCDCVDNLQYLEYLCVDNL